MLRSWVMKGIPLLLSTWAGETSCGNAKARLKVRLARSINADKGSVLPLEPQIQQLRFAPWTYGERNCVYIWCIRRWPLEWHDASIAPAASAVIATTCQPSITVAYDSSLCCARMRRLLKVYINFTSSLAIIGQTVMWCWGRVVVQPLQGSSARAMHEAHALLSNSI